MPTRSSLTFALVDVAVAPDGSLLVSDLNRGIWRIFYGPDLKPGERPPALVPDWPALRDNQGEILEALLGVPQPSSEPLAVA